MLFGHLQDKEFTILASIYVIDWEFLQTLNRNYYKARGRAQNTFCHNSGFIVKHDFSTIPCFDWVFPRVYFHIVRRISKVRDHRTTFS